MSKWNEPPTKRDWIIGCAIFTVAVSAMILWMPRF